MKFQKSVDLGGIYFAKVELTLKFDQKIKNMIKRKIIT